MKLNIYFGDNNNVAVLEANDVMHISVESKKYIDDDAVFHTAKNAAKYLVIRMRTAELKQHVFDADACVMFEH